MPSTLADLSPGRRTTVAALLEERASGLGERPFLRVADSSELTFAEFNAQVNSVAHGLLDLGVRQGDRVILLLPNSIEFLFVSYALRKLGAIEVALNTEFRGVGLARALNLTAGELLVTDELFTSALADIVDDLEHLRTVVIRGDSASSGASLQRLEVLDFSSLATGGRHNPAPPDADDTTVASILFTSGTTGPSKGCMLSHRSVIRMAEAISMRLGFRPDDCLYSPFPLYHADAALLTVLPALLTGCRAAVGRRFSASGFWDEARRFEATIFDFMGATLAILWKNPIDDRDQDHAVRLAWGVPMPSYRTDFERRFDLKLVHCYGLTDAGMPCFEDPDQVEPVGSCGRPSPPYELGIVDELDDHVGAGTVGEIVVRSTEPSVLMDGYWGAPEETLQAFRNFWFHTGDLGSLDEQGYLYFEGRKSDSIRRRGENISAFEVEEVLMAHPDIQECAAIGVPSDLTEEDVMVFVVRRTGSTLDERAISEFCRDRLARFMVPTRLAFLEAIPKTPTGKPEKYKLRELADWANQKGN
jgi:carnitine-CoA ligase